MRCIILEQMKNPERRKYLSHRSRERSFIREVATNEDLQELKALIVDCDKQLEAESCKRSLGCNTCGFSFLTQITLHDIII